MSSVDQALIRLHARQSAPVAPALDLSSHAAIVANTAPVVSREVTPLEPAFSEGAWQSTEVLAISQWRADQPTTTLAGPHFSLAAKSGQAEKKAAVAVAAELPAQAAVAEKKVRVIEQPTPAVAPLSLPERNSASAGEAAWNVERFQHSETCTRLLKRMGGKLAALYERLAGAADVSQRVLVLTSAQRGEGRTTLAICLAEIAARAGARVALVDGDLECPALARELGLATECNWARAIRSELPLNEMCVRSLENKLTVVPLAERVGTADAPSPREVADLLHQLAADHDLVVVDAAPLAPTHVSVAAAGSAESSGRALIVRDLRRTAETALAQLVGHLEAAGLTPQGVVDNFSK